MTQWLEENEVFGCLTVYCGHLCGPAGFWWETAFVEVHKLPQVGHLLVSSHDHQQASTKLSQE